MRRRKRIFRIFLLYLAVFLVAVAFLFPIYWIVATAFKTNAELFAYPPKLVVRPRLGNFLTLFASGSTASADYLLFMKNSAIITTLATVLSLVIGGLGAYGLSQLRSKRRKDLAFWILSTRMMPPIAAAIPFFLIMHRLRIIDTPWALVIAYTTFNLPFVVWMLEGFFREIPSELHEAAQVDGCNNLTAFYQVVAPLAAPGLAATTIFCFIFSWNEFLFALILTGRTAKTLPVAVASIWTDMAASWGPIAAASLLTTLPILVGALLVQRHLLRGLTMGAIK